MKERKNLIVVFIFFIAILSSCKKEASIPQRELYHYAFFGHTYQSNSKIDQRIDSLNLSVFDQIWLGGDICSETTAEKSALQHIDSVFNISNPTTHWSLGNHDTRNGNINWITEKTKRNTFYASYNNGITILVLNTTLNASDAELNEQYNLIETVCDTISKSSHLILLSHHNLWNEIDTTSYKFSNVEKSQYSFSSNGLATYNNWIYPKLEQVSKKKIKVIHIAGDYGQKETEYEFLTIHNVQLLGSGITSNIEYNEQFPSHGKADKFLVFTHNIIDQSLYWSFEELK